MDSLTRLQTWYATRSDGEWEHGSGIQISTVDNPGWLITADLEGTACLADEIERFKSERSEVDWVHMWKAETKLQAAYGAKNLSELLDRLLDIVETW